MIKRRGVVAGVAGWTIVGASAVRAQAWPSQQIKIVVPYIPGGATDTAGRVVAEKMGALPVSYTHLTLPTKRIV